MLRSNSLFFCMCWKECCELNLFSVLYGIFIFGKALENDSQAILELNPACEQAGYKNGISVFLEGPVFSQSLFQLLALCHRLPVSQSVYGVMLYTERLEDY